MARSPGASSGPKKDWRARPPREEDAAGWRYFRRFFFSLLLAGLAVWLVVLLIPGCGPEPQLVCLPIRDYEVTVPPVPYAVRNAEELAARLAGPDCKVNVWDDFQTSKSLASLGNRLQPLCRPQTPLVVYVAAHGVSDNGRAYLLCGDYQPRSHPDGRIELGELLEQIRACPARLKLLILDLASLVVDPRLGFVVNEFPRLAEAAVRDTADPNLYVLLSHSPLESSHLAHAARRSVFNYFVTEGLRGAANRAENNDYVVDLAELYDFVRIGVAARSAQLTDERQTQTPLLLRGGEGVCQEVPKGLALVKAPPQPNRKGEDAPEKGQGDAKADASKGDRPADKAPKSPSGDPAAKEKDQAGPGVETGRPAQADVVQGGSQGGAPVADPAEPKPIASSSDSQAPKAPPPNPKAEPTEKSPPPAKNEIKEAASAKAEKPAAAQPGKAEAVAEKPPAPPARPAEKPAPAEAPKAAASDAVADLLRKAWERRDQEQRRDASHGWSPVDYAPHLWREYNEILLGLELRHRFGVDFSKERLRALADLAEGREGGSGFTEATILGRLRRARQDFLADAEKLRQFELARAEGWGEIEEAIKLRNDLMFAAPYYVRWHALAALASSAPSPLYQRVARLLDDDHLPNLVRILEQMERLSPSDSAEHGRALAELRAVRREVEEVRAELEEGAFGFRRMAKELLGASAQRPIELRAIEGLLATPLLDADLRARLIQRLASLDPPLDGSLARRARSLAEAGPPRHAWERFAEQLRLELALARLADRAFKPAVEPAAAFTPHLAKTSGELWEEYRKLGRGLGDFYRNMADRIEPSPDKTEARDVQAAARMLRLVDARDVSGEWIEQATRIALVPPPRSGILKIHLAVPDQVALARDQSWTPIDIEMRLSGPCGDQGRLGIGYDASRLEIVDRDAQPPVPVRSEELRPVRLDRNKTEQGVAWRLSVRPKGSLAWSDCLVTVRAAAEKASATGEIRCVLPPPDVVDVVVERVLDLVAGTKTAADRISRLQGGAPGQENEALCDVFPNRTTEYIVSLRNRSGKAKKVAVELYAPPPDPPDPLAPLAGPLDRWGKPLPRYRLLASAAEAALDTTDTPVPIPFAPPKSDSPDAKKETADAGEKPPEKPEKKEKSGAGGPLVSRGLACVIYDLSAKEPKASPHVRWLRFRPVAPRQYLQPSVRYEQGRISVEVRPLELASLPRLSEDSPITVDWDVQGVLDPETRMLTHAEIRSPNQKRELFADVPPKPGQEIPVRLTVDGYPRAFVFRVPTDRPLRIEELRDLRDVRIVAPRPGQPFRVPLAAPLFTEFQVDAPADAFRIFGADRPRDVIEVTLESPGDRGLVMPEPLRFYSDRQFEARVVAVEPGGMLKIDARVHDFKTPLNAGDLKNAEVAVRVTMKLNALEGLSPTGRDVKTASVRVIFDGARPTVKLVEAPLAPVPQGNDVVTTIEVNDPEPGSGVAKVEYALRDGDLADFDEKDKPAQLLPPNIQRQLKLPPMPTKQLKPGKYVLVVRATDQVGWQTTAALATIEIAEPPPPPKPMDKEKPAAMSSISGRAIWGSPDARIDWIGLKVTLKELNRTTTGGSDGRFEFPDVPPGTYTLQATGIGANRQVEGSVTVTVTEKPAQVDLPMR